MLLTLLLLMFSAAAIAAVAVVPVFACHHLVASFPALTAITAVSDDQCYTVAGFLSLLRSPLLLSSLLLLVPYCC